MKNILLTALIALSANAFANEQAQSVIQPTTQHISSHLISAPVESGIKQAQKLIQPDVQYANEVANVQDVAFQNLFINEVLKQAG